MARRKNDTANEADSELNNNSNPEVNEKAEPETDLEQEQEPKPETEQGQDSGMAPEIGSRDVSEIVNGKIETRTKNGIESHWRGGKQHTKEKQVWEAGSFTVEQFKKLEKDAYLHVIVVSD